MMKTMMLAWALWLPCAAAPRNSAAATKVPAVARLPAGGVKAAAAAIADFSEHLRGLSQQDDLRPWMKALAVVENYETEIRRDGAQWVVTFRPVLTSLVDGSKVKGGGAEYRVDPSDYKIIGRVFPK